MKKCFIPFLLSCIIVNLVACTASPLRESTGEYIDSSATTTKVKARLVDALGTKGLSVVVKTFKDEVQLSGFVDNQAIRQRAAKVAANVEGVKSVRNNIVIKTAN